MKTKLFTLVVAALLLLPVPNAQAFEHMYAGFQVGMTWLRDADGVYNDPAFRDFNFETSYDSGFSVTGFLGARVMEALRLEGEITYRNNDFDRVRDIEGSIPLGGDISSWSLMFNGFYDFVNPGPFTPYLGGGIGFARIKADANFLGINVIDDSDTVFAWQLGGGVSYALNPQMALVLDYRYFATDDPEFRDFEGDRFKSEYASHNVSVGMRFLY